MGQVTVKKIMEPPPSRELIAKQQLCWYGVKNIDIYAYVYIGGDI